MKDLNITTERAVSPCLIEIGPAGREGEGRCLSAPASRKTWPALRILAPFLMLALIALTSPVHAATDAATFFARCPAITVAKDTVVTGRAVVAGPCTITVAAGVGLMKFVDLDLRTDDLIIDGTAAAKLLVKLINSNMRVQDFLEISIESGNVIVKEDSALIGDNLTIASLTGDILIKGSSLITLVEDLDILTSSGDVTVKDTSLLLGARQLDISSSSDGIILIKGSILRASDELLLLSDSGEITVDKTRLLDSGEVNIFTIVEGDITVKDTRFRFDDALTIAAADVASVIGNKFPVSGPVTITGGESCISKSNVPAAPCS